jgi:hypothetical protein
VDSKKDGEYSKEYLENNNTSPPQKKRLQKILRKRLSEKEAQGKKCRLFVYRTKNNGLYTCENLWMVI